MRRHRPLTVLDIMILVAATAFGICLARTAVSDALMMPQNLTWTSRPFTYFLLPWTLAFIPIRLRRPRPSSARIMRQPGMAACCAVAVVTLVDAVSWTAYLVRHSLSRAIEVSDALDRYWRGHSEHLGPAVAAVWLGLILSRRWRPERSWIDRFGRVIGIVWLLTLLCEWRFGRWPLNVTHRLWGGNP